MKILLLFLAITILSSQPVSATAHMSIRDVFKLHDSVYKISCYTADGTYSQGAGFVINNVLITNYHVAGECDSFSIANNGMIVIKKREDVAFSNPDTDILGISFSGHQSLSYSIELPDMGQAVYTMGYPRNKFNMTHGDVTTVMFKYNMTMIISSNAVDYGNSGGILFNKKGQVVGMTSRMLGDREFVESIPMSYVLDELDRIKG